MRWWVEQELILTQATHHDLSPYITKTLSISILLQFLAIINFTQSIQATTFKPDALPLKYTVLLNGFSHQTPGFLWGFKHLEFSTCSVMSLGILSDCVSFFLYEPIRSVLFHLVYFKGFMGSHFPLHLKMGQNNLHHHHVACW